MNKSIIKEMGMSLLIVIAIILLIIIICYDKVSIGQVVPKIEEYSMSEDIKNEISKEISEEDTEIVTTYKIDASDLKQYEKTKEYNKGKRNPFSASTAEPGNSGDNTSSEDNNSSSQGFYDDEGIK